MLARVKAALTRKFGIGKFKLPAWAWLSIAAGGIFLWYRRKGKAGAGLTDAGLPQVPADSGAGYGDAGGGSLGGGGSGGSPPPDGTLPPLADPGAVGGPVSYDPGQLGGAGDYGPVPDSGGYGVGDVGGQPLDQTPPVAAGTGASGPSTARQYAAAAWKRLTVTPPNRAPTTYPVPSTASAVRVLPNGAIVYTAPNGNVIEQAPGHSRYVIQRGPTAPGVRAGVPIPANATNVRILPGGGATYQTPSGTIVEQPVGKPRYVIRAAPGAAPASRPASPAGAAPARPAAAPTSSPYYYGGGGARPAPPARPAPAVRYYTYRTQVPLRAGQTLHFAAGRGYYAA